MPDMPMDEQAATAALEAEQQQSAATRQETMQQAAPPADEPLSAGDINALKGIAMSSIEALAGGQIELPEIPDAQADAESIPGDIFALLVAFATVMASYPEGEPYAFDPIEMGRTNAGLQQMADMMAAASKDKALLKAMEQPMEQPMEAEAEMGAEVEDEDLDKYLG